MHHVVLMFITVFGVVSAASGTTLNRFARLSTRWLVACAASGALPPVARLVSVLRACLTSRDAAVSAALADCSYPGAAQVTCDRVAEDRRRDGLAGPIDRA
ncbi:hypothetical protein FHR51_001670 [Xanthomonas arboricola]|uniref:hypothetical protein n=1 Tax=Xanthomonas cannabis TaxID=1885674 RepID=UPI00141B0577|nr:hypothetical protein [Xanthomonas cannabis]MBB3805529.1 hypothetical protein [Xanthomonas cannabis]